MRKRLPHLAVLFVTLPLGARAGELPQAKPAEVGLKADVLARLGPDLKKLVDDGKIAGGVVLVARHGKVAYLEAFGYKDLESKAPMTEDTIFAIASMTKPITCVAVMTLIEQGKLGLDDDVAKYLPELTDLRVLGDPRDDKGDVVATVPAQRPITVRHLLSHTSGIAYDWDLDNPRLRRAYRDEGLTGWSSGSIAALVKRLGRVPLAHQPGEGWTYGYSHDVLGRLIEVVSRQRFDAFLQGRVFTPLDMLDTTFLVPRAKRDRVATVYQVEFLAGGQLKPLPKGYGTATFLSGGSGLFSTARDYARFAQMLANRGTLDGVRVLKPETIAAMTANQIGRHNAFMVLKYGLGFGLVPAWGSRAGNPAIDRYFWAGLFSTNFWVDPRHDVTAVLMTQVVPLNHGGAEGVFRRAVDAALKR
jgi:CubicO group peptidase (beta-lactamase class C family)